MNRSRDSARVELQSLKAVIRCRDYAASREFYTSVLGLGIVEEWDQEEGQGCIFAVGDGGYLEIAGQPTTRDRDDESYTRPVGHEKIDLQLRTDAVDAWAARLRGKWPFEGPVDRPWGQRYLWVRDPDNVRIALFEEVV